MKTLLFILIIVSFIACNKQNDAIVDYKLVHYTAFCTHKGFDVTYSNENGEAKTVTINDTTNFDVKFINVSNQKLSISATAHNVHSYISVGVTYNGDKYSMNEMDNSVQNIDLAHDTIKVCAASCQLPL
jgi:hypothetical protein